MLDVDRFAEEGVVELRGAFSAAEAAAMRSVIWDDFEERTGLRRDDPATWPAGGPDFHLRSLKGLPVFEPVLRNDGMRAALDGILGTWVPPKRRSLRLLVTFPSPGPWVMPVGWHFDGSFERSTVPVRWVQLWALLDRVEPCGGGTLLLAGSHRLVDRYGRGPLPDAHRPGSGVNWARFMAHHALLRELAQGGSVERPGRERIDRAEDVDGVPVRVIEVCGDPGDVFLSHGDTFHCVSPNTSSRLRLMMTCFVHPADALTPPAALRDEGSRR